MNRLTEYHCGVAVIKDKNRPDEAMAKLAMYEDLEEQGLLLRFPCKIGDTVYEASAFWEKIIPRTVACVALSYGNHIYIRNGFGDSYEFGVDVFLTKEEAEEALKKMEKEK